MACKEIYPEAVEMVKSTAKYAYKRGVNPLDYITNRDVSLISGAFEKGMLEKWMRKIYTSKIKENIDLDFKETLRNLPRRDYEAFSEVGEFFQNNGAIRTLGPYDNPDIAYFFEKPVSDYIPAKSGRYGRFRKYGRPILYVSLIACLIGSVSATHGIYSSLPYNSNTALDEDHNCAVSFPEMLDNLNYHGAEAFANYFMHTFFGANLDKDGDGLIDYDEKYVYHTDPNKADTDGDGLTDKKEFELGTDPMNPDTDGDNLSDGTEVYQTKTDPLNPDTSGNGNGDYFESTHIKLDYFRDGSISGGYESPKIDIYLDKQLEEKIKQATMHLSWGSGKSGTIYMNDKFLANGEVGEGKGGLGWGCFVRWYGSMDVDLTNQINFKAVPIISLRGDYIGDVRVLINIETTEPIKAGADSDYLKVGEVHYSPREWANFAYCRWG